MSTPIYLNNNSTDELTQTLLKIAVSRQANDIAKEQVKIRQQELKVQTEERDAKRQADEEAAMQKQAEQAFMLSQIMGPARQIIGQAFANAQTGVPSQAPMPQMSPVQQQFTQFAGQNPEMAAGAAQMAFKAFEAEKAKAEADKAFDSSLQMALDTGLLDKKEANGLRVYRMQIAAGTAPDAAKNFLVPTAVEKASIAKTNADVQAMTDKREAGKAATEALIKLGLAQPGGVIEDAPKLLAEYVGKVRSDARAANLEIKKAEIASAKTNLLGTAMQLVQDHPDWTPQQVHTTLKSLPGFASLGDGEIRQAVVEAPKKVLDATALDPDLAKARLTGTPALAGIATAVKSMREGKRLGILAAAARVEGKGLAGGLGALGAGVGGIMGLPAAGVGAIPGAAAGGGIGAAVGGGIGGLGAPLVRGAARRLMDDQEQVMLKAARDIAAFVYRGESQGSVRPEEQQEIEERYFGLKGEGKPVVEDKINGLLDLAETIQMTMGMPPQAVSSILQQKMAEHDKRFPVRPPSVRRPGGYLYGAGK